MLDAYWSMLKEFLRKAPTQNRGVTTPSQKKNTSYVAKNRSWVHITRLSRIEEHVFYHFFWASLHIYNTFSTHDQHTHRQGSLPVHRKIWVNFLKIQSEPSHFVCPIYVQHRRAHFNICSILQWLKLYWTEPSYVEHILNIPNVIQMFLGSFRIPN